MLLIHLKTSFHRKGAKNAKKFIIAKKTLRSWRLCGEYIAESGLSA
jgi:hypothetical protein